MQLAKGIQAICSRGHALVMSPDDMLQAQQEFPDIESCLRHKCGHAPVVEPQQSLCALREQRVAHGVLALLLLHIHVTVVICFCASSRGLSRLLCEAEDDLEVGHALADLALQLGAAARPLAVCILLKRVLNVAESAQDSVVFDQAFGERERGAVPDKRGRCL